MFPLKKTISCLIAVAGVSSNHLGTQLHNTPRVDSDGWRPSSGPIHDIARHIIESVPCTSTKLRGAGKKYFLNNALIIALPCLAPLSDTDRSGNQQPAESSVECEGVMSAKFRETHAY